jgi:outer membrane lipoprotein-sorting protein
MTRLALLLCATALIASACGTSNQTNAPAAGSVAPELEGVEQLQAAVNAHQDVPQLIVLISPT